MCFKIVLAFFMISYLSNEPAFAQETPARTDTTHLYENIETYSEKNKFTQFMFRLFFKPVAPVSAQRILNRRPIQEPYSSFQGKIIRTINIETLDPFGYSIGDTITASLNFISKTGNRLHMKTHPATIKNLLLIRRNQTFDSLLVKESERLVRSMSYITDVSFYVRSTAESSDSVDIYIRELDTWSIIPGGSVSENRISISLKDNNFMGFGHEFQNGLIWNHTTGDYAYKTKYYIPNIYNTYINSTFQYGADEYGNFIKNFAVDRPFFSPLAKWAAGINFSQHLRKDSIWSGNIMQFKYNAQDYWAGNAFRIFKGNSEYYRTTNFITAARFIRIRYLEMPPETIDTLRFYSDENFYLAGIGISTRLYVQDKYIFKFGLTEDVPVGRVIGLTGGYQKKNSIGRLYLGARFSSGKYYPWGYLSSNFEYGTFLRSSDAEQGVFSAGVNYFTNLTEIGNWKFRQFIKPQIIFGIQRTSYDSLTINDGFGLDGFNSPGLAGNSRLLLTTQTQSYAPWNFIGFHFGPFFTLTMAMLGSAEKGFRSAKVYSQVGVGVLIKNDNLVMNTFQLSVAFYPVIPGKGENILKFNSFQTTDFGFRNFEIGKPEPVLFR